MGRTFHFPSNQELTMNSDDTYDALILAKSHFQLVEAPAWDHVHTTRIPKGQPVVKVPTVFNGGPFMKVFFGKLRYLGCDVSGYCSGIFMAFNSTKQNTAKDWSKENRSPYVHSFNGVVVDLKTSVYIGCQCVCSLKKTSWLALYYLSCFIRGNIKNEG